MRKSGFGTDARAGRATWTFVVVAVVLAAVFARLGVWQLTRLVERRAVNDVIEARLDRPPLDLSEALDSGTSADSLSWRRFSVAGEWDVDREVIIRGRAFQGTPGVHVVTPLLFRPGEAVLVLRGWLPAADGLSADLAAARPPGGTGLAVVEGLALESEPPSRIPVRTRVFDGVERQVLGSLSIEEISGAVPYDLVPVFLLATAEHATDRVPIPVREPTPSDGPHLWYAVQWFGFALISLAGAFVYIRTRRRSAQREGDA